jgi:hypothetical protein
MPDELEDNKVEGGEESDELDEKPELPKEPADKNEEIAVQVQSREEKKRNRFKEVADRAERAERAAEEARREAQEARALHQRQLATPQDQSRQAENPLHKRLRDIDEATRHLHKEYQTVASARTLTDQEQAYYEERAQALQTAKMAAVSEATRQPVNEQEMFRRWKWNDFTSKHSDIFGDQKKINWAIGRWHQLVGGEGLADSEENAERILDEARVKFGIKPRRAVANGDAATRARLSGISSQGGASSGDLEGGAVKMGKRERQMAEELYDKLPPREAWQKWANGPGKRAAQKMAARK